MFTYKVYTDEELNNADLLPDGEYDGVIRYAEERTSRNGNPMLKVVSEFKGKQVHDYLLTTGKMAFKFKRFCNAVNVPYDSGNIDLFKIKGKNIKCKITKQVGSMKDDGTFYPDRNIIEEYLKAPLQQTDMSEDIPF